MVVVVDCSTQAIATKNMFSHQEAIEGGLCCGQSGILQTKRPTGDSHAGAFAQESQKSEALLKHC